MRSTDLPWTGKDDWRMLFQLAAFARDQSGADGVIAIFLKGHHAQLGWCLPPELYPQMPMILDSACRDSLRQLAWVLEEISEHLPDHVRKKIETLLQQPGGAKSN